MFNSYGYGGYLIWQMSDVNKVFIDGRGGYLRAHRGVLAIISPSPGWDSPRPSS